ncbi:PAAR domain-containing protein [Paraburkholderia sediminicola]
MKRYLILDVDQTRVAGTVHAKATPRGLNGRHIAHEAESCHACGSTGKISCDCLRLPMNGPGGRRTAPSDDLRICKCDPPQKLVASQQPISVEV